MEDNFTRIDYTGLPTDLQPGVEALKNNWDGFHRKWPSLTYYGNLPAKYSENTVSWIEWMSWMEGWVAKVGSDLDNLNQDFNDFVDQYNNFISKLPDNIKIMIKEKFDEERPGMISEIMNGLEDKIFSTFKQPIGKNFLEKLENEFDQRGLNITWYGAIGDNETDNTDAIMKAYEAAKTNNTNVYVPSGIYLARFVNVPDNRLFKGNGIIVNDGKKFNISTNTNHADKNKLQNPEVISRYTYGRFNSATALSVNANTEDEAAVVGIDDDSIGLSQYDNRDSVSLFITNTSHGWHITTDAIGYGADYVDVGSDIDLSNVRVGMFVDTDENPKATGIVRSVVGNRVNVNKWVRRGANDSGIVPVMPSNVVINPTTAIWGQNTVLQIDPKDQDMAVTGYEMDVINNQPHRTNIDGFTVISDGTTPANSAFTARSIHNGLWNTSYKSQDSEYGLFHSGGSVGVHVENPKFVSYDSNNSRIALASTSNKEDILLRANNTDGAELFTMYNDGKMSRFTLQRQLGSGNVSAPVVFANGDIILPDPSTYPDELIFITNTISTDITITSRISFNGIVYNSIKLGAFKSAMFICDGVEYYNINFNDAFTV